MPSLTGLPIGSITTDHASIPEIPEVKADEAEHATAAVQSARMLAISKQKTARGDQMGNFTSPDQLWRDYNRNTTILNNFNEFYNKPLPTNNFSSGFSIQVPLFDLIRTAKARESAAEALRARVEAEQAQRQNDIQIATLTGSLRELDTLAEIASLKQQIASEQLKTVLAQLELGNGAGNGSCRATATYRPRPSNWRASTSARSIRMLSTPDSTWQGAAEPAARPRPHGRLAATNCTQSKAGRKSSAVPARVQKYRQMVKLKGCLCL